MTTTPLAADELRRALARLAEAARQAHPYPLFRPAPPLARESDAGSRT